MKSSPTDSETTRDLLERIQSGDSLAAEVLFASHRDFLRHVLEIRMDRQMLSRVDVSDVIQETHLQAVRRLDDFLHRKPMPFRLWLRKMAIECLLQERRKHVETKRRSVSRELPLPDRSSVLLANQALAGTDTPSKLAARKELAERAHAAIAQLSEPDREVLLMRNIESLSNQETALALEIEPDAARKRYTRALKRLRDALKQQGLSESST